LLLANNLGELHQLAADRPDRRSDPAQF
jgi:hypothetical protein